MSHVQLTTRVTLAWVSSVRRRHNGPYSLLVRASYFISCSVYTRSTSVIFVVCKWRWGCRYFLTSRISMPCSEAIRLIIR